MPNHIQEPTHKQLSFFDPVYIPLSKKAGKHTGKYMAIVSFEDADLASLDWCVSPSRDTAYAIRTIYEAKRRTARLHRVIMERMLKRELLPGEQVDHINHDGLDNRRENLRLATQSQNMQNRKMNTDNTSGYKGVTKCGKKWLASIGINGKQTHLGVFATKELAHAAYCEAAEKHYGEFANPGGMK